MYASAPWVLGFTLAVLDVDPSLFNVLPSRTCRDLKGLEDRGWGTQNGAPLPLSTFH